MKDIHYFLKIEEGYCEAHKDAPNMIWNDDLQMFDQLEDPAYDVLMSKPFSWYYNSYVEHGRKVLVNEKKYNLSETEHIALNMFYGKMSHMSRDDFYYNGVPEWAKELFNVLDSVVTKAPQNKGKLLYRFCKTTDKDDMKVSNIVTFSYNLTCTNFDWKQDKDGNVFYIITTLANGNTRAHNLFEILGAL